MPRSGQIIPKYLVPHVETYINNNTIFQDAAAVADEANSVPVLAVFASAKGRDRIILRKKSTTEFIREFGTPNFNLYGQANYMPWFALQSGNATVFCMRVTPDDATFANAIVLAKVKPGEDAVSVKFSTVSLKNLTETATIKQLADSLTVAAPNEIGRASCRERV